MGETTDHLYLIALGSNQRHPLIGKPAAVITAAFDALEMQDINVFATSSIILSRPFGPSRRQYANAAATIVTVLSPPELLARLQSLEAHFGRRKVGQKWRARVLDLDIILWSGGIWSSGYPALTIPHPEMQKRRFVLEPSAQIAPKWRDPLGNLQLQHLLHRINRAKPLDP